MKKNLWILLLAAGAGVFLLMQQHQAATVSPTGAPVSVLTTDQKRKAINQYWETTTPPANQDADGGRFEDIINSISPAEIDTIYQYVTQYLMLRQQPAAGSPMYAAIQAINNEYQLFT